jgi:hypothetical protein
VSEKHGLIGYIIQISDRDRQRYCVSRVTKDLGNSFLLARRLHFDEKRRHCKDLPQCHVLSIAALADPDLINVYESLEEFVAYALDEPWEAAPEREELRH